MLLKPRRTANRLGASEAVLKLLCVVLFATGCATTRSAAKAPEEALEVSLKWDSTKQMALSVSLTNRGSVPFAVANYYGVQARWIRLDVENSDTGEIVYWPEIEIFDLPPYDCLRPGDTISVPLDLRRWQIRLRGQVVDPMIHIPVYAPGKYRVKAAYRDWANHGRNRCPSFSGESSSEWIEFQVPPE